MPNRPLATSERRFWIAVYVLAALAMSVAFFCIERIGLPEMNGIIAHAYEAGVAVLRGCAAATVGISLILDLRLRALLVRGARGPT